MNQLLSITNCRHANLEPEKFVNPVNVKLTCLSTFWIVMKLLISFKFEFKSWRGRSNSFIITLVRAAHAWCENLIQLWCLKKFKNIHFGHFLEDKNSPQAEFQAGILISLVFALILFYVASFYADLLKSLLLIKIF